MTFASDCVRTGEGEVISFAALGARLLCPAPRALLCPALPSLQGHEGVATVTRAGARARPLASRTSGIANWSSTVCSADCSGCRCPWGLRLAGYAAVWRLPNDTPRPPCLLCMRVRHDAVPTARPPSIHTSSGGGGRLLQLLLQIRPMIGYLGRPTRREVPPLAQRPVTFLDGPRRAVCLCRTAVFR